MDIAGGKWKAGSWVQFYKNKHRDHIWTENGVKEFYHFKIDECYQIKNVKLYKKLMMLEVTLYTKTSFAAVQYHIGDTNGFVLMKEYSKEIQDIKTMGYRNG